MSPTEQRKAIEQAAPDAVWKTVYRMAGAGMVMDRVRVDPLSDLNACHEMEKTLTGGMRSKYDAYLTLIAAREHKFIWEMPAKYKAEAFLLTVGKAARAAPKPRLCQSCGQKWLPEKTNTLCPVCESPDTIILPTAMLSRGGETS